ncbi:hypothetical protein OJAV_G00050540 [Oryzias javanicus]|uniref:G2 and S phase-expressed protein 1 N-terminal domain-containing protein n=1 Tax=Oryzias javanicus TaxID=123683 RepID=A0A437D8D6_ORYJA|nr:hypothetical protein OJAV_G00050540 [Oryzias javanicus]
MAFQANSDVLFLQDEKFDFDVSLSPASSKEDEDEVFEGLLDCEDPLVSVSQASELPEGRRVSVNCSPLPGELLNAVCQEAHSLLQNGKACAVENANITGEEFLQNSEAKMKMLCNPSGALSPIKRETFCLQDTPKKQLPPAIQLQLPRGGRRSSAARPPAARSASSPVGGAKFQPRSSLRAKAPVGVAVVLPSKPVAPPASRVTSSRADRARLQPPAKAISKRSPSSRLANRAESSESLLSDSTSVASDISDSSINSTLSVKRSLVPPTKSAVRKSLSGGKAPAVPARRGTDRKNTSSSSSSVSSFNSSLTLSPAKGKLNSSVNRRLSSSTRNAPGRMNRPTDSRPRRSAVHTAAEQRSTKALHPQARKVSETERANKSTPLRRAESVSFQPTPSKRLLEKTASVPSSASSLLPGRLKSKPEALVFPTPGVRHTDGSSDMSKGLKPKRLVSLGSMNSVPVKPAVAHLTPSENLPKSVQVKPRRPSALPTPVRSRSFALSSNNQTPRVKPVVVPDSCTTPTPSSSRKHLSSSCVPKAAPLEEPVDPPDIPPFCLEEEEADIPAASSEPQPPEKVEPTDGRSTLANDLMELENASETPEVLLLDLPAPARNPPEKLLIDLTNTPDLICRSTKSATDTQLIDLSSPLIKWSPEGTHENAAPLINLSF